MQKHVLILLLCALTASVGLPSSGAAHAGSNAEREFSSAERQRLAAGQLVQRPRSQRRGSLELMGGSAWQVIDARPDVVWQALLDTNHYHRMMPRVIEAKLVSDSDGGRTVFIRQGAEGLVETSYYLKVDVNEESRELGFSVDEGRPHDLKAAYGFYSVRPYGGHRTLLTYAAMADPGGGIMVSMLRGSMQKWMLKTPWMIKRFVEGSGRWIYG